MPSLRLQREQPSLHELGEMRARGLRRDVGREREFPGRPHLFMTGGGWEEVADHVAGWLERNTT